MDSRYLRLFLAQARGQAQYRTSFWFDICGSVGFGVAELGAVFVVFSAVGSLGGFTRAEGMLIAALAATGFQLADLVVGNIDQLRVFVRTGLLDSILPRPLGVLGQLVAMDFAPRRIGRTLMSAALVPVAGNWAGVQWTTSRVLLAVLAPLAGAVLFGSVFVATATVAFWWIDSGEFAFGVTYGGQNFASYPVTVYEGVFQKFFAYGLGFSFAAYHPALYLLGRVDPLGGPRWLGWMSPAVAAVAAAVAGCVWRVGVRHYRSTGS